MSDRTTGTTIAISTESGAIEAAVVDVAVTEHAVVVELDMSAVDHDAALASGWFHLGPLTRGDGARPFGDGPPVRLEVRLDPSVLAGLRLIVATAAGFEELLVKVDQSSPLRSHASWYASSATRAVPLDDVDPDAPDVADAIDGGSLREGYRTAWSGDLDVVGLPLVAMLAERLELRFHDVVPVPGHAALRWSVTGSDASWTSTAIADEADGWCAMYSVVDHPTPVADRAILVERASDLNTALMFGAWHVAADSPTVGFRSTIELPDRVGAPALLDRLVTRHLDIVDEYASVFADPA